jgi:hypothetical protein
MTDIINRIRRAQIDAAERAVIASIPKELRDRLDAAQREHVAKGGCPGCGSMILAVHEGGCPTGADDLY